jgi:hypothetical protein
MRLKGFERSREEMRGEKRSGVGIWSRLLVVEF